jgi:glycosyltransferase involved in cell wall biosynthesis
MDPGILVPPKGYGGIERMVAMFAKEYVALGHEVHLLVTNGSKIEGCVMHNFGPEGFPPNKWTSTIALPKAWLFLWKHRHYFHLIHNFGRLAYLLPILNRHVCKIQSYQREITEKNISKITKLKNRNLVFTACSADLLSRIRQKGRWAVVYNAVDFDAYKLSEPENITAAPLMFLGRIEKVKGCHIAIQVALKTGSKLIIAGNKSSLKEEALYFEEQIVPYIDGKQIVYTGPLNDEEKNYYLGQSKALLFPIEWNEPFGIVMIEAMACGTPVIAFKMGSVDEVVEEGITGFKAHTVTEMIAAIEELPTFNRSRCRERARMRFSSSFVAGQYLALFQKATKDICIVTTGQPSANPRVLKEYQAFRKAGHRVKVIYTYSAAWSFAIDNKKFEIGELPSDDFILAGGDPGNKRMAYFFSRLLFYCFRILSGAFPFLSIKKFTIARSGFFLWRVTAQYKADIYLAHYLGALPAALHAGKKYNVPVIFDAEDYHRGEEPYYKTQIADIVKVEDGLLPAVSYITTASPLICRAYQLHYPLKKVVTINNVFSSTNLQPVSECVAGELKLFWFSQNIGPNRGLELIIEAMNIADCNIQLSLLGNTRNKKYVNGLLAKSKHRHRIQLLSTVPPDDIFAIAAKYDIGLAAEIPYCVNRDICLTNKIFTYLLAGNCVLASDTAAQQLLLNSYPDIGYLYSATEPADLAEKLMRLASNKALLQQFKNNANQLAAQHLNWEKESQQLLHLMETF